MGICDHNVMMKRENIVATANTVEALDNKMKGGARRIANKERTVFDGIDAEKPLKKTKQKSVPSTEEMNVENERGQH